jgi:site-specific recombinase XerD
MNEVELRVEYINGTWVLTGSWLAGLQLVNDYLGYLADRNYSPKTVRSYAFSLLAFCRWLLTEKIDLDAVDTKVLLKYLSSCRQATVLGRSTSNVVRIDGTRVDGYAPATVNHRLAVISGLFGFWSMRDPEKRSPIPRGVNVRRLSSSERNGLLAHINRGPKYRSELRLRDSKRLPHALSSKEVVNLIEDMKTWRDRAICGLMVYCGLRSSEVLGLKVTDIDIGARWIHVLGKGRKERKVPLDIDVAGVIQTYLLVERPESLSDCLFLVAKGPNRGLPLSSPGLRSIFRYHRITSGVVGGNPHSLRHSFGTCLAEAGVDLAVMQALLGHTHTDTTTRYIHLAPIHIKAEFDAAYARSRNLR